MKAAADSSVGSPQRYANRTADHPATDQGRLTSRTGLPDTVLDADIELPIGGALEIPVGGYLSVALRNKHVHTKVEVHKNYFVVRHDIFDVLNADETNVALLFTLPRDDVSHVVLSRMSIDGIEVPPQNMDGALAQLLLALKGD